jgi:signal transduction histidine kinase
VHQFLAANRVLILERSKSLAERRNARSTVMVNIHSALPSLLVQITLMIRAQQQAGSEPQRGGIERGDTVDSLIGRSAAATGWALSEIGLPIEDIVLGYGDLCQAITELAVEFDAPFSVAQFRILNLCLDTAIANAVKAFTSARDEVMVIKNTARAEETAMVAHEMRNLIHTSLLAFTALKVGNLSVSGSTGLLAERSLLRLGKLADKIMREAEDATASPRVSSSFNLSRLIEDVKGAAKLASVVRGIKFSITPVDPKIEVHGDPELLYEAVVNLIQNALKFTKPKTTVKVRIATGSDIVIEVCDQCGGLGAGDHHALFDPFVQHGEDRSGLGLGLTIVKRNVERMSGTVGVVNMPGHGCAFTIRLPRPPD